MRGKKGRISPLLGNVGLAALTVVEDHLVSEIKDQDDSGFVDALFGALKRIIEVHMDDDTDNKSQVKEIIRQFAHDDLSDFSEAKAIKGINKIKDDRLRRGVHALAVPRIELIRLLTDENKENGPQVKAHFTGAVKDPQLQRLVLQDWLVPLLGNVVPEGGLILLTPILESMLRNITSDIGGVPGDVIADTMKAQAKAITEGVTSVEEAVLVEGVN